MRSTLQPLSVQGDMPVRRLLHYAHRLSDAACDRLLRISAEQLAHRARLPRYVVLQILAIEDKRFLLHPGVDPIAVARAALLNAAGYSDVVQGGSTIPQQLYSQQARQRNTYRRNVFFKLCQMTWAISATLRYSKAELFTKYVDQIYLGRNYYGIDSAASGYCGKNRNELDVAEGLFLADRIARPNKVVVPRLAVLFSRSPIKGLFLDHNADAKKLSALYERHFRCGEAVKICLANFLKK